MRPRFYFFFYDAPFLGGGNFGLFLKDILTIDLSLRLSVDRKGKSDSISFYVLELLYPLNSISP